jgi:hypothetical protein
MASLSDSRRMQVIGKSGRPAPSFRGYIDSLDESNDLACRSRPSDGF